MVVQSALTRNLRRALLPLWAASLGACATPYEALPPASETFRVRPPPVPPRPTVTAPAFAATRLDNGLAVLTATRHTPPLVHVELAFAANSGGDPELPAGLSALAFGWLLQGAGLYGPAALDEAFGTLGATPRLNVDVDGVRLHVTVLSEHAEGALELLAQIVQHPWLDGSGFDRQKSQQLANLTVLSAGDPWFAAERAFATAAYSAHHAYGHNPLGSPASLARIDAQMARRYCLEHIGPKSAALIITGDIEPEQALQLARRHYERWQSSAERSPAPRPVAPQATASVVRIARQDSARALLLVGRPALPAGDPDEAALRIASAAIGVRWRDRLTKRLQNQPRVERSVWTSYEPRRGQGQWLAQAELPAEAMAPALSELFASLGGLPLRPLREREIEAARVSQLTALPGAMESADVQAGALAALFLRDRPLDRYEKLAEDLSNARASDVHAAAVRYLNPAGISIVAVGDPAALDAQLSQVDQSTARTLSSAQ
jgi:zinc protease